MGNLSRLAALSTSLALTLGTSSAWSGPLAAWCEDVSTGWKVTVVPDRIAGTCDGGRGFFRVSGNTLSYYMEGMRYPNWEVKLAPDGSADTAVGPHIYKQIRVKVAPGTGPREVTTLNLVAMCDFKFIPDTAR
jgi:hypothetical protein